MPTFVTSDQAAGTSSDSTRSVAIGTGTNRKALAFYCHFDNANSTDTYTVTFDPGGAQEAAFTQAIAMQFDFWSGNGWYKSKAFYYDIPDGLSGTYNIGFVDSDTSNTGAGFHVVVLSDCATGAPEAAEAVKTLDTATEALTTITDDITTLTDNAMIVCFGHGGKSLFGTATEWTPDSGQTEIAEANLNASLGSVSGRLTKATAGLQTIQWSMTDAAGRGVLQSMLLAIAPVTSVTHYTVTELTISATAD